MSQWHIVAVPNKENATNVDRSLSYEPRSQMHAPDCGSRMYDPEDGGQEPPKDREDLTLHISLATSHGVDDEHMDNSVNVLGQGGTRSGTTDNHMHGVHDEDMSDGEEPTNKDNAEPRVPDIGSENILGTGRIPTLKQIGDAQGQCEFCKRTRGDPNLYGQHNSLFVEIEGLLHHNYELPGGIAQLLVIPRCFQVIIITLLHHSVSGHLGEAKTVAQVRLAGYWWLGMHKTAKKVVRQCRGCTFSKAHHMSNISSGARRHISISRSPWDILSVDYVGPLTPDADGYCYLLVAMCNFSKYVKIIPTRVADAATTAHVLFYQVFLTFGFPRKLLSDRGGEFVNKTISRQVRQSF